MRQLHRDLVGQAVVFCLNRGIRWVDNKAIQDGVADAVVGSGGGGDTLWSVFTGV